MSRKCRDCKHYQPSDSESVGRCQHPRFGSHPAVLEGLVVSADDLLCAKTDLYFWERRPRKMRLAYSGPLSLVVSGDHSGKER